jgi:hypothetical protein
MYSYTRTIQVRVRVPVISGTIVSVTGTPSACTVLSKGTGTTRYQVQVPGNRMYPE